MVRLERIVLQGFKSFKRPTSMVFPSNFAVITGPNGCGKCLTGDALVQLSDGSMTRIDDLVEAGLKEGYAEEMDDGYVSRGRGDVKICCLDTKTLKSVIAPVSAFVKRKSPKKLTRIKTRSGREITATGYHPLFVLREDRIESSNAGDLREGMSIAVPRVVNTETPCKKFFELADMIREGDRLYAPWRQEYVDILKQIKRSTWNALADETGIPKMHMKGILTKQAVNMASVIKILRHAGKTPEEIAMLVSHAKSRVGNIPCRIAWENTREFSRFLGYLMAEGRLSDSNQIWFTNGNEEIVEDYKNLAEKLFNIRARVYEYKPGCWDVIIYSRALQRILMKFGMPKGVTKDKSLTNLFLSHIGKEEISEFLGGLYSGDGYVSDRSIEITTASRNLSLAIESMLSRLGILFTSKKVIKIATNTGYSGEYWVIASPGAENAKKFAENINIVHGKKKERLLEIADKEPNPNIDLIPVNSLVKDVAKDLGINVKKARKQFPRLDAYCYKQCLPSIYGLNHLIDNLFCVQVPRTGTVPQSLAVLTALSRSDILWDDIVQIEEIDSPSEWVYDLSVEGHHNFVANSMFVHNSNLGDSIAFVLGKAPPRHMRAKKAEDLIFHGGKSKKPSDYAKVKLVFSNERKILPFDEEEVRVGRRLNKSGVSSYKLNGKISTRQHILDIFMQARMNPGGHNIIRQGDVTKVIEMNPYERREIIDEISGIREYDEKRMQALKQLEKVEEKVREAEIILEQKEEIIEKMKSDRDSALEYQRLTGELELVRSTVVWKEFTSSEKNMGSLEKNIEERESEIKELEVRLKGMDREMDSKDREMESLMKEVMKGEEMEMTKRISKIESSLESKENLIRSNEREIGRLKEMVKGLATFRDSPDHLRPVLETKGVRGFLRDLIIVPDRYRVAAEVAGGSHMNDIVVDDLRTAIHCVKYLKAKRIGRARFLPLDRISSSAKSQLPQGTLGWLSELIHHDREYSPAIEYVFGRTACVNDIDKAKRIAEKNRIRMVTLDGDVFETSGAVFGGYYVKQAKPEVSKYNQAKDKLEEENRIIRMEIKELGEDLGELRKKVKETVTFDFGKKRSKIKEELEKLREERRDVYDKLASVREEVNRMRINRARYEANFDNLRIQWEEHRKAWDSLENKEFYQKKSVSSLKDREREILEGISSMGPVNLKAIEEFEILYEEFGEFRDRVEKISREKESIVRSITEIENRKRETFTKTMGEMGKLFMSIYKELTKGEAELGLEDPADINSGLMIFAQPPNKKLLYIDAMSGGEKVLAALAFLFTIQRYKPSPFYVLDEVDAALDRPNTRRVVDMIKSQSRDVQFIIVSHNSDMVNAADIVYGVSMEDGESKVMGIKLPEN